MADDAEKLTGGSKSPTEIKTHPNGGDEKPEILEGGESGPAIINEVREAAKEGVNSCPPAAPPPTSATRAESSQLDSAMPNDVFKKVEQQQFLHPLVSCSVHLIVSCRGLVRFLHSSTRILAGQSSMFPVIGVT